MKKIILTIILLAISSSSVFAQTTHYATGCTYDEVKTKYDLTSAGDTILVPACPDGVTWNTTLALNRSITLQGNGIGSTVINQATGKSVISVGGAVTPVIKGFTFVGSGSIIISMNSTSNGWRITNNRFYYSADYGTIAVYVFGANGLVDGNQFVNGRVQVNSGYSTSGWGIWLTALALGSDDATYIENNTFTGVSGAAYAGISAIDATYGGKTVFRFNNVTDMYLGQHSVQGDHRGPRKWEIYNNTITVSGDRTMSGNLLAFRAGTGVIFNNVITSSTAWPGASTAIMFDNVRSLESRGTYALACNGSSPWDGNEEGKYGYPCRDQIGRSIDSESWVASSNPVPSQALDPAYIWGNTYNGSALTTLLVATGGYNRTHIVADRDYYVSASTAKPDYTPYTCPHPLADPDAEGACDYEVAGTAGYSLTGGEADTTSPTVTSFYIYAATTVVNFSEPITATSGAAFTVSGLGSAMTLTCPAVETAASSMTCTNSRTVYQAEGNGTYGYTGTKVIDAAENQLATIDSSPTAVNLSTEVEEPPAVRLTVTKTGTGCTITSSPSGIIAGTTTTADYDTGTVVTLGGYVENGWNPTIVWGGDCASDGTVTMSGAKTCTATCTEKKVLNWAR